MLFNKVKLIQKFSKDFIGKIKTDQADMNINRNIFNKILENNIQLS